MRLRSLVRRRAAAVMLALAATTAAAACGSSPKASPSTNRATFRNGFLEFSYPTRWTPSAVKATGALHFAPMLYLSSQRVGQPCHKHLSDTVCGWPLRRLRPGGVLIVWENRGAPGWSLRTAQGRPVRIGGRAAKKAVDQPGACAAIGADETIGVEIERPLPNNWTAVTACLRGPGLAASERDVAALLASLRFGAP